jgi:predicted nucleotidyltransferase
VQLHAYVTDEAIALDTDPLSVSLEDGVSVWIPNAFSFLLMKLHACADRLDDEDKQLGRHHALDVSIG